MRPALLALAMLFVACAVSALDQGRDLFNAGRYPEAKARLEKVDGEEYRGFDPHAKNTYALYRGLVFGALGDRPNARAWLGLAKQMAESHPANLSADDTVRLNLAEQQYGPLPTTSEPPLGR
jgi:hypothetical protein